MAHTVIRDLSPEPDKTLFLIMDGDNNLTADPKTLDKVLEKRETTEVKILRLLASSADSEESEEENDARPKVRLTFEEILPENPEDDSKGGDSAVPPDIVDPLSQLDTEAMQRLKKALASDQAKQLLGDNVTAMLDVLSVEDPASFIRNSIKRDHCYTQLSPSADPRGPSFVQNESASSTSKAKDSPVKAETPKAPASEKIKKIGGSEISDAESCEGESDGELASNSSDRSSDSDYHDPNSGYRRGRRKARRPGRPSGGRGRKRGRPPRERQRDPGPDTPEPHDTEPVTVSQPQLGIKRGRPRKEASRSITSDKVVKCSTGEVGTVPPSSPAQIAEPIPIDNAAAKVLSADAIRLGRPAVKSEEERKRDMARILDKLDGNRGRKVVIVKNVQPVVQTLESQVQLKPPPRETSAVLAQREEHVTTSKDAEKSVRTYGKHVKVGHDVVKETLAQKTSPSLNVMGGKYPRRENRKLPSHLADAIVPELFSSPDSIRRTSIKLSQKPATKKKEDAVAENDSELISTVSNPPEENVKSSASDTLMELENMLEEGLDATSQIESVDTVACEKPDVIPTVVESVDVQLSPQKSSLEESNKRSDRAKRRSHEGIDSNAGQSARPPNTRLSAESPVTEPALQQAFDQENNDVEGLSQENANVVSDVDMDSDIDDALSEASWNSEDDPDKLWCICRKPHNNRFMICCDNCEEWFHGKCVGITKSIGKQMEQDGLDWTCPPCTKKKRAQEKEKELSAKPVKPTDLKPTIQTKLSFTPQIKCVVCGGKVRENSVFCSDECIGKHSQKVIAQLNPLAKPRIEKSVGVRTSVVVPKHSDPRVVVMDPHSKKVLTGPSAPTLSNLASWLKQNPSFHVLLQRTAGKEGSTQKLVQIKQFSGVTQKTLSTSQSPRPLATAPRPAVPTAVYKPPGGQLQLTVSPNSKHIKIVSAQSPVIKTTPVIKYIKTPVQVVRKQVVKEAEPPALQTKTVESPKIPKRDVVFLQPKRRRKEKLEAMQEFKSPNAPTSKVDEVRRDNTSEKAVRDSVKKTLGDALKARVSDAKDLKMKESEIDELANKIEERLYRHFDNKVDVKYKSKYRSLVFNIKDLKNETLYRKIVENAISPRQLVRLTADELASQELAQWREKENQHNLEMIKKNELELMALGQTFIVKNHKGEEVLEKDSKVAAIAAEIDPNTSAKELVSALNSVSSTTSDYDVAKDKQDSSETSLMKMKKKENERRKKSEKEHHRKRDRSSSRSKRSKSSRKRSRSRSRGKDHRRRSRDRKSSRSSRHSRDKHRSRDKDKKSSEQKEKVETPVAAIDDNVQDKMEPPVSDEADYEPTSTVNIKTPEITQEEFEETDISIEPELVDPLWKGEIAMSDVGVFTGKILPVCGNSPHLDTHLKPHTVIIGRIPFNTVWDYLSKQIGMMKEVLVVQFLPEDPGQQAKFDALHAHLTDKSRCGVIDHTSEAFKDFYMYPHLLTTPFPTILQSLNVHNTIPVTTAGDNVLLGIIVVRSGSRSLFPSAPLSSKSHHHSSISRSLPLPNKSSSPSSRSKSHLGATTTLPLPDIQEEEDRSHTPPLPHAPPRDHKKRKIKVHVAVTNIPPPADDGDSPYEPASSDDDLPPLSKMAKKSSDQPYKPVSTPAPDPKQIQKEIEEMNRAIEEQTQELQTLVSVVPRLPAIAPVLQHIPGLLSSAANDVASFLSPRIPLLDDERPAQSEVEIVEETKTLDTVTADSMDIPLPPSPVKPPPRDEHEKSQPMDVDETPSSSNPSKIHSEIAIPSNIHEILASIKQVKTANKPPVIEIDITDAEPEPSPTKPTKKKMDVAEVFEETCIGIKSKQIKFDLKLKSRDVDERVIPRIDNTIMSSALDVDERQIARSSLEMSAQDQDYRLLPRLISSSVEIPLPVPSADRDDRRSKERRKSDSDHRRNKPKDPIENEWDSSIRHFEERQRRRNETIRGKEIERLRRRSDED